MILKGKKVKIRYTLRVDGQIIDSTAKDGPFEYTQGQDGILFGLQHRLLGLNAGDQKNLIVGPDDGFGALDPNAIVEIPKEELPYENMTVGTFLRIENPEGESYNARVRELRDDLAVLDFNHPLAGKELHLNITVVDVK